MQRKIVIHYSQEVMNMTESIAKRIVKLREERKWSRYRLAKRSGLSFSYLAALEEGKHSPSLEVLAKIATGLEIDLVDLIKE
jgi:transcriptional regulator with XRE-family HTH domain